MRLFQLDRKIRNLGSHWMKRFYFPLIEEVIDAPEIDFLWVAFPHQEVNCLTIIPHIAATEAALALVLKSIIDLTILLKELNVGGGFGVRYTEKDIRQPYSYFLDPVMATVKRFAKRISSNVRLW